MAWDIEAADGCAIVRMNTNEVNAQNGHFFADLHRAFDRLERQFGDLPVVLTGHGSVFSAGIDFQYSFDILSAGSDDRIRQWYRAYRDTNLRIFQYPRPTVAAVNGHAIAGGLITALGVRDVQAGVAGQCGETDRRANRCAGRAAAVGHERRRQPAGSGSSPARDHAPGPVARTTSSSPAAGQARVRKPAARARPTMARTGS